MENNILSQLFMARFGTMPDRVVPLPASGSHRRYFRLVDRNVSAIGVSGTDCNEDRAFCTMAEHFRGKGIPVPEIYGLSPDGMYYLQEDLGDISLFDLVSPGRETGNYSPDERRILLDAVSWLPIIQYGGAEGLDFKACCRSSVFDGRTVMSDLNYFKYCFLKTLGLEFDEMRLQDDFERLRDDLMAVPSDVFMYRDFQSRNIMVKDGSPYYIDFQGGMKGPGYYDLASFVWQARARYPQDLKNEMIKAYLAALAPYASPDPEDFRRKLGLFVLVRTLQVLGAYGFRGYFERKPHFLRSIPAAMENLRELLAAPLDTYPYLAGALGLTNNQFAFLAGTAINDTSSVAGAQATYVAMNALDGWNGALNVKLVRTTMLIFVALFWTVMMARSQKNASGAESESLFGVVRKTFPMFILWFVIMAGLNTYGVFTAEGISLFSKLSKFLFASALAGVGFKIKFVDVFSKGAKPIALGGITWLCVAASSLAFVFLFAGYIG